MEKTGMIEKLREYREKINDNEPNTNIVDIIYLGQTLWKDKVSGEDRTEDLYIVKKEITKLSEQGKKEIKLVNNYYLGDKCIGGYIDENQSVFSELIEEDKLNAVKQLLEEDKEKEYNGISLKELESEQLENIAKTIETKYGKKLSMEDIKAISEIDANEEVDKANKDNDEKKELSKKETSKIIQDKQEVKIDTKVDEKKTIGQAIGLKQGEYSKIAIVYSDQIDNNSNHTRYSFVAIRKDGTSEIIDDKLEMDKSTGDNQLKDSIKIDANETARKDNKTLSRYKIKGKEQYLSVENGQYGEVKAYYGKGKTRDGNMNVETQLATTNVRPTSIELRKLQADKNGIYNTDNMAKEANEHFENYKEESIDIKSIDGDENTVDHVHIDNEYMQNIIDEIMEVQQIENVFTRKEVADMAERFFKKEEDISNIEKLKEELKQEIEQDAERMHTMEHKQE